MVLKRALSEIPFCSAVGPECTVLLIHQFLDGCDTRASPHTLCTRTHPVALTSQLHGNPAARTDQIKIYRNLQTQSLRNEHNTKYDYQYREAEWGMEEEPRRK